MTTTPTTAVVNITPAQAAEWLTKNNTHNRTMREGKVAAYARDMAAGAWVFNGDSIRFAPDGTLLDGQHRLAAIMRAEVTIPSVVIWGIEPAAQDTMDIGAHRMLRDQLILHNEVNSNDLAAIARRALMVDRGVINGVGGQSPTHAEMIAYIEANPSIRRAAEVSLRTKGRLPASPSAIGTAYFMCGRRNVENAETFFVTEVIDGIGLHSNDPAYALRQRIQREVSVSGRQMPPDDVYRYSILAWNAFRSGKSLTKLQAPRGGWSSGSIPEPK